MAPGVANPGLRFGSPWKGLNTSDAIEWREDGIVPYWRLFYHLVWATKQRQPLMGEAEERAITRAVMAKIAELELMARAIGLMPDHVHVIVGIPPKLAVADVVKRLKGASSHAVNTLPAWRVREPGFAWQAEYGAHSVGERGLSTAIAYVLDQKERHAARAIYPSLERITD